MLNIYSILSPSGKIYIGQTNNLYKRVWRYKDGNIPGQPKLHASLKKYGWSAHELKVLCSLPDDAGQKVLDEYEITYIDFYKSAGFVLLNIKEGGKGGKHSPESIEKMKAASAEGKHNWQGKKHKPETIEKLRAAKIGRRLKESTKQKLREINTGKKQSEEAKLKNSISNTGAKNGFYGKKHSEESKLSMSRTKKELFAKRKK